MPKTDRRTANPDAELESTPGNAPNAAEEVQKFDSPVRIKVHHVRKRLIDIDNLSVKAAIDGLVRVGILADDSPEFVKEVSHTQEKGRVEKTRITIEAIEPRKNT